MASDGLFGAAEDVGHIRVALQARMDDAWERLDDAVSELHELHDVPLEAILHRVSAADLDD